ncbi:hypothetical protein XENOCAPTIV_025416, partial [Xenoophorus captivus]
QKATHFSVILCFTCWRSEEVRSVLKLILLWPGMVPQVCLLKPDVPVFPAKFICCHLSLMTILKRVQMSDFPALFSRLYCPSLIFFSTEATVSLPLSMLSCYVASLSLGSRDPMCFGLTAESRPRLCKSRPILRHLCLVPRDPLNYPPDAGL